MSSRLTSELSFLAREKDRKVRIGSFSLCLTFLFLAIILPEQDIWKNSWSRRKKKSVPIRKKSRLRW